MKDGLVLFTIYDRTTSDYPGEFVCRRYSGETGRPIDTGGPFLRGETLEAIRGHLPLGLVNLGRQLGDDPVIVETWV